MTNSGGAAQFSKVLDYDPNDLIAQVEMAKSMSYDGDQEGALVEYDRILKVHPGLYDAMIGKAFALLWSGRMDEAREMLQKGLSRHPDDRKVREALASLPKGTALHKIFLRRTCLPPRRWSLRVRSLRWRIPVFRLRRP